MYDPPRPPPQRPYDMGDMVDNRPPDATGVAANMDGDAEMRSDLMDLTVQKLRETDRAILVTDGDPDEAVWLPKSQVETAPADDPRHIIVTLPEWLAIEKGLV